MCNCPWKVKRFEGHWWGFINRNYVVWPMSFLMNVFIALKGTHFLFLLNWYSSKYLMAIFIFSTILRVNLSILAVYTKHNLRNLQHNVLDIPGLSSSLSPESEAHLTPFFDNMSTWFSIRLFNGEMITAMWCFSGQSCNRENIVFLLFTACLIQILNLGKIIKSLLRCQLWLSIYALSVIQLSLYLFLLLFYLPVNSFGHVETIN